jgi:hypothetical protein
MESEQKERKKYGWTDCFREKSIIGPASLFSNNVIILSLY